MDLIAFSRMDEPKTHAFKKMWTIWQRIRILGHKQGFLDFHSRFLTDKTIVSE